MLRFQVQLLERIFSIESESADASTNANQSTKLLVKEGPTDIDEGKGADDVRNEDSASRDVHHKLLEGHYGQDDEGKDVDKDKDTEALAKYKKQRQ